MEGTGYINKRPAFPAGFVFLRLCLAKSVFALAANQSLG